MKAIADKTLLQIVGFDISGWNDATCDLMADEVRQVTPKWRLFCFDRFGWRWTLKYSELKVRQKGAGLVWQTLTVHGRHQSFRMDGWVEDRQMAM